MKRAAVMVALLAAASAVYGRELPVQRDLVRPMDFGEGAAAEDLRAAPDVAMAIERREEFARAQKGEKKSILALGSGRRSAGNAVAYYSDTLSDAEEGRQGVKRDNWLVQSVTQGAFGSSTNGQSGVRSVLSQETENNGASPWGWLAEEVAQRQSMETPEEPQEEEPVGMEEVPAEPAVEIPATVAVAENSMEERDARRDEIRNAPPPPAPPSFAELQLNAEEIRNQWAPDSSEVGVIRTMRETSWGGESAYGRVAQTEFDYSSSSRGFGLPSVGSDGGSVRFETTAWEAGEKASGAGQWRGGSDSSWAPLQPTIPDGPVDIDIPKSEGPKTKTDSKRVGTSGTGTMPW